MTAEHSRPIPMAPDDAFGVLSNSRRRQVILSVARTEDEIEVGELAVEIAAMENLIDPREVTGTERTRVYVALVQTHLDQLADAGAIEYDSRAKVVCSTGATEPLAEHIREISTACYDPSGDDENHADDGSELSAGCEGR